MRITGRMPQDEFEAQSPGRGLASIFGYLLAAVVALGGGAWLALHLSRGGVAQPVAIASPAASASPSAPTPSGPAVALASTMPIQVTGDSASAPERNQEVARKMFEDHKNPLLDSYSLALAGESTLQDAMIVRIRVLPGGSVDAASVRASTNPNPGLDAQVVKDVSSWSFAPFSGGQVEMDYPVIFTNDPASIASLESQLSSKLASLSATEAPEYASAPPSPAPPVASEGASAATPATAETPPVAAESTSAALPPPVAAPASHKRPHREVARPAPPLTLQERVKQVLSSNSKLRRVDCYTSGTTVTIFGKVFDAGAKQLAERVARGVPGVGNVIDSLSTDEGDWAARQGRIAAQLSSAGLNNVTIKVIDHDAYLGGSVKTDDEKDRAVTITESAEPVHVRTNLIMVEPGRVFGF